MGWAQAESKSAPNGGRSLAWNVKSVERRASGSEHLWNPENQSLLLLDLLAKVKCRTQSLLVPSLLTSIFPPLPKFVFEQAKKSLLSECEEEVQKS